MPSQWRADFHDFEGVTYLNCAYHGPMPRVAAAAVGEALALKMAPHRIRDEDHFRWPDRYRAAVARLIGVAAEEVAVTDSATDGILLAVNGLPWAPGDEVVVPERTFPSNRLPWLSLERRGVRVKAVPEDGGIGGWAAAVGPRTRVVSIEWVSYQTGRRQDLAALGALCRERGVLLAVDASQGVGGLALDLAATPVDLLACAGYKWMLGPYGTGFAWLSPALAARLETANVNWLAVAGAEDFSRLGDCALEYVPGARRFDRNEAASFLNLAGATAAAEYLAAATPAAVEAHVRALLDRLLAGLPADWRLLSPLAPGRRSNILCLAGPTPEATAAARDRLAAARVRVSLREGALRISPHLYNGDEDVDRLLAALQSGPT